MKKNDNFKHVSRSAGNSSGGTLLGVFIGLVFGILIALGVVLYLNKATLPFQDKYEGASKPATGQAGANNGQTTPVPLALPGKPGAAGSAPTDKPRFDFYGILEGKPPVVQTQAPATAPAQPHVPPAVVETKSSDTFFLQLGAFQKPADAENLKAKLALTGFDAMVQEVDIPNKGIMHRVRVGPFKNAEEMNRVRGQLSQSGIEGTVIKQHE